MDVEGGLGLLGDRLEVGVGLVLGALAEHRVEETSEALEPVRVVGQLELAAKIRFKQMLRRRYSLLKM